MEIHELVREIDGGNYSKFLENEISVLNFFNDWHMNCLMCFPIMESLAEEFSDICFGKVNVDEADEIAARHNVGNVPCLIIFRKGQVVERIDNISEEVVRERIEILIR